MDEWGGKPYKWEQSWGCVFEPIYMYNTLCAIWWVCACELTWKSNIQLCLIANSLTRLGCEERLTCESMNDMQNENPSNGAPHKFSPFFYIATHSDMNVCIRCTNTCGVCDYALLFFFLARRFSHLLFPICLPRLSLPLLLSVCEWLNDSVKQWMGLYSVQNICVYVDRINRWCWDIFLDGLSMNTHAQQQQHTTWAKY